MAAQCVKWFLPSSKVLRNLLFLMILPTRFCGSYSIAYNQVIHPHLIASIDIYKWKILINCCCNKTGQKGDKSDFRSSGTEKRILFPVEKQPGFQQETTSCRSSLIFPLHANIIFHRLIHISLHVLDYATNVLYFLANLPWFVHLLFNIGHRIHNRRMVTATEAFSNIVIGKIEKLAR